MTVERFLSEAKDFNTGKRMPYCPKCGHLITYHALTYNSKTGESSWVMDRPNTLICTLTSGEIGLIMDIRDRIISD